MEENRVIFDRFWGCFTWWQFWCKLSLCSLWLVSSLPALSLGASRPISHLVLLSSSSLRANKSWLCDKNLNTFSSDTLAQTRPSAPPEEIKLGSFVSTAAAYRFLLITHYNSLSACAACISVGEEEEEEWVKYNSSASARLSVTGWRRGRSYCQLLFFLTNAQRENQYSCWPHGWSYLLLTANECSRYTTWPKICGQLNIFSTWPCWLMCCYNSLHSSGRRCMKGNVSCRKFI